MTACLCLDCRSHGCDPECPACWEPVAPPIPKRDVQEASGLLLAGSSPAEPMASEEPCELCGVPVRVVFPSDDDVLCADCFVGGYC